MCEVDLGRGALLGRRERVALVRLQQARCLKARLCGLGPERRLVDAAMNVNISTEGPVNF